MRGNAGIFIIIGIVLAVFVGVLVSKGYLNLQKSPTPAGPQASPSTLSEDPKYKDVKEKYNLSEEQLQILSTVDPNDNQ